MTDPQTFFAITMHNVQLNYERAVIMAQVNVAIPAGVMLAIVGPNGAGKTTLLKAMVNLLPATEGEILIFGQSYAQQRTKIAYVPQRMSVDWDFPITVLDVVLMGCYARLGWFKRPKKEDVDHALYVLALVEMAQWRDTAISQLSGGQQQRVFIARALMQDAQIYLLDEPFVGLDMATEKKIMQLLRSLQKEGKTIVVVHHDLYKVREHFDWTLMINRTVIACGPTQQIVTCDSLMKTYGEYDARVYHKPFD